jgi:hypothetical protein
MTFVSFMPPGMSVGRSELIFLFLIYSYGGGICRLFSIKKHGSMLRNEIT